MRTLLASVGLALLLTLATEPSVSAQEPPAWMKQTLPEQALKPPRAATIQERWLLQLAATAAVGVSRTR